jgi:hypothetical protein
VKPNGNGFGYRKMRKISVLSLSDLGLTVPLDGFLDNPAENN